MSPALEFDHVEELIAWGGLLLPLLATIDWRNWSSARQTIKIDLQPNGPKILLITDANLINNSNQVDSFWAIYESELEDLRKQSKWLTLCQIAYIRITETHNSYIVHNTSFFHTNEIVMIYAIFPNKLILWL